MEPLPASAERSVRRSRLRLRVLLLVSSMGEAYEGQLARSLGVQQTRVRWVMFGREPYYSRYLSLVAQGLVRVREGASGRVYVITTRGRRKARSLARRARPGSEAF